MPLILECDRQTHTQTHDDSIYRASIASRGKNLHSRFMLPIVCNEVVVASQSFFEVCLLPFSSGPNWSAVVDCGLLIISNQFLEAFGCPLFFVAVLVIFPLSCRRLGLSPLWCCRFDFRRFDVSPFWPGTVLITVLLFYLPFVWQLPHFSGSESKWTV